VDYNCVAVAVDLFVGT